LFTFDQFSFTTELREVVYLLRNSL
jgi:hypothetical protein